MTTPALADYAKLREAVAVRQTLLLGQQRIEQEKVRFYETKTGEQYLNNRLLEERLANRV